MKIYITSNGYVKSCNFPLADIEMEITDDRLNKICSYNTYQNWRYIDGDFILEDLLDDYNLRLHREDKCFRILDNRSVLWFNNLNAEQTTELNEWYQAWLNVTETKIIPIKPNWL